MTFCTLFLRFDIRAPVIVFNDVDLTCAVNGVAFASFVASGQTCVSGTQIILQDMIYDFLAKFLTSVEDIRLGIGDRKSYIVNNFCHASMLC